MNLWRINYIEGTDCLSCYVKARTYPDAARLIISMGKRITGGGQVITPAEARKRSTGRRKWVHEPKSVDEINPNWPVFVA